MTDRIIEMHKQIDELKSELNNPIYDKFRTLEMLLLVAEEELNRAIDDYYWDITIGALYNDEE
jgi:hypothetical protein